MITVHIIYTPDQDVENKGLPRKVTSGGRHAEQVIPY